MRTQMAFLCVVFAVVGCKKSTTGTGGGGGGWLVGSTGLMSNIDPNGVSAAQYDLGSTENLSRIACRYAGEAWVIGAAGTLLYTNDSGKSWRPQSIPTTADLRALATQDAGPVFIGGDDGMFLSIDTGATWQQLAAVKFSAVAAAQAADTVLALSDDGGLWSYDGNRLARTNSLTGARAIAVSPDGGIAMIAGATLWRSTDSGATWTALDVSGSFDDVRVGEDGTAVAVGAGGAIANIDANGAVSLQHAGTADLHTVHIAEADSADPTGYTAGEGGQVFVTHDLGASWTLGPNVGRTVWGVDVIGHGHL
jgi:photosystem II stability/assembly factor-like uncharacterized protein